jgi:zinc transport system ATP-binding protein
MIGSEKKHGHPIHPVERNISLRFDSVSFSYGEVKVLENASFHIHQGEFVALVGPNGSGKTTVLKLLLGLEQPVSGKIEIFESSSGSASNGSSAKGGISKGRDRIGYVPQQAPADQAFPISVREVVRMGRLRPGHWYTAEDKAAVESAMQQADIADLARRSYRALSGGQRRRVLVARALAAQPEILILDEPTANMDAESAARLFETLGKLKAAGGSTVRDGTAGTDIPGAKTTILIVTHDTDFVSSLTDRVLCMGINEGIEHQYGIVQHRTESVGEIFHGDHDHHGFENSRILHGDSIPADSCYDNDSEAKHE